MWKRLQNIGLALFLFSLLFFSIIPFLGEYRLSEDDLKDALKEEHFEELKEAFAPMMDKAYASNIAFVKDFNRFFDGYNEKFRAEENWEEVIWDDYAFAVTKAATEGWILDYKELLFFLSIGIGIIGALLFVWPKHRGEPAGIRNNGIYFT